MSAIHLFADLTTWKAVPVPERREALAALALALGAPWRVGRVRVGRHGLGSLLHDGVGLELVIVPGGWLRMGFSADDLFVLASAREDRERMPWGLEIERARPTRWVRIRPFLLATAGLPPEEGGAATGGGYRDAYRRIMEEMKGVDPETGAGDDDDEPAPPMRDVKVDEEIAALIPPGFRLPCEAELEWAFSEAGTTRWAGIPGDHWLEADQRWSWLGRLRSGFGLHGIRDDQNLSSDLWSAEEPRPVARGAHTQWQDDDAEMLGLHPSNRFTPDEYGTSIVRLAADLPGADAIDAGAPGELAEHDHVLRGLAGDDPVDHSDALVALTYLAWYPGEDVDATHRAVTRLVPQAPPALRARLLVWLGNLERPVPEPALIELQLADADDDVRAGAAHALACTPAAREALIARLAVEENVAIRAGVVLAAARLGADVGAYAVDPLTRAARAIGNSRRGAADLDGLIEALDVDDFGRAAVQEIRKLDADALRRAAVPLARRAGRDRDQGLARLAVEAGLGPSQRGAPPRDPASATPEERALVAALIDFDGSQIDWFGHGLPQGRQGRKRWIGELPPGAIEPIFARLRADRGHFAALDPVTQLVVFLERHAYDLSWIQGDVAALAAAAIAADPEGTRGALAALVRGYRDGGWRVYADDLKALAAAFPPGEAPAEALDLIDDYNIGHAVDALRIFPTTAIEARLMSSLEPLVAAALATDGWSIGAHDVAQRLAPLLALVPSARAARAMLLLGWAGGQPAAIRVAVGHHGGADPAIAAVLADYDAIPQEMNSWPQAREALRGFA